MKGKILGDLGTTELTISGRQTAESFKCKISQKPEIRQKNPQKIPNQTKPYKPTKPLHCEFYSPH